MPYSVSRVKGKGGTGSLWIGACRPGSGQTRPCVAGEVSGRGKQRSSCRPHWLDKAVGPQEGYRVEMSRAEGLALVTVDAPQPKEQPLYVTGERIAGLAGIGKSE